MRASFNFFIVLVLGISACEAQQASQSSVSSPTPYSIVSSDGNSSVWQSTVYEQEPDGQITPQIHSYTELATGLNHLVNGQWVPSKEEIDILPDGTAAATNGQHQVYFPGDIYNGEIMMVTPDGKILQSRPIGLSFDDGSNTVMIAVLTNSIGELESSNVVIYPNAFVGVNADLLYIYTKAGFEQDIVLRTQPPDPSSLGLNPGTTRIQVLTEFFNPPQPATRSEIMPSDAGQLQNDNLDFGTMHMGWGKAFMLGTNSAPALVTKQWLNVEGRQFLVEEVPVAAIAGGLESLPLQASAATLTHIVSKHLVLPPQRLAQTPSKPMHVAKASSPDRGLVLDYVTLNSGLGSYTFRADTTYYISGAVDIFEDGTATFEGGAVFKYGTSDSCSLFVEGPFNWEASAYRPVIFTSMSDNSVGEKISGSDGNPHGNYLGPALEFEGNPGAISHFRISYMQTGLYLLDDTTDPGMAVAAAQFVDCGTAIQDVEWYGVTVENALFANSQYDLDLYECSMAVENATFANSPDLVKPEDSSPLPSLSLTNCILSDVTNENGNDLSSFYYGYNGFYNSPELGTSHLWTNSVYPFQSAGAGNFYLTNGCTFLNVGTTNIDPVLLADLATKTVYAPNTNSYAQTTISTATTISTNVTRDNSNTPSLGYHYDPIDYVVDELAVTNAILTVTNGAVLATYNEPGIQIENGGSIISTGTPTAPNWFVRYQSVQDETNVFGGTNVFSGISILATNGTGSGTFQFSKFSIPAAGGYDFDDSGGSIFSNLVVQDSELYGGTNNFSGGSSGKAILQNNLFERSSIYASNTSSSATLAISNNLFWGTAVTISQPSGGTWYAFNNDFDSTTITNSTLTNGYNAYLNCTGYLIPTNTTDIFSNASLAYQSSFLGNFYQPTNSPLIKTGSTNAELVGLYHFTVTTNQIVEATNIVSIGYHYVATDTNGVPLDSNGDGTPDYLEDPLGNGLPYNGADWALAILVDPTNELANVGTSPTLSVTVDGIAPLGYQWYFNSNLLAGATSPTLTLNDVITNDTGAYFVVVTNDLPVTSYSGFITSSVAMLTVIPAPTIAITNPANNFAFAASSTNLMIQAAASDPAGTISQVQYFEGTTNLGIATNTPYTFIWTNAPPGNYALTAVATDNGLAATSTMVNVTISPIFETNTMTLWLKADAITNLANDTPISIWYDSSGWGKSAVQLNSVPTYVTNEINGYPAVHFNTFSNSVNQNLYVGGFMNTATNVDALVVVRTIADRTNYPMGCWYGSPHQNPPDQNFPNTDGSISDDFGTLNTYLIGVPASPLVDYNIYEVSSQAGIWAAWLNEILIYQSNINSFGAPGTFWIGHANNTSLDGDVAEVLIFNTNLTTSERAIVSAYLNGKYTLVPSMSETPSNLVATAISATQVGLTWSEPLDGGATQTSIERSTNSTSGFVAVAQIADALSYVDTNLIAGTTYYYQARAINVNTWSPYSNQTNATTLSSGVDIPFANLMIWLKADSGLAQISTNTPVSSWIDQSGNGNNVIQNAPSTSDYQIGPSRPTWISGTSGGFPVVHFTQTTNQALFTYNSLNGLYLTNSMGLTNGVEAFAVVRATTDSPTNPGSLWYFAPGAGNGSEQYPNTNGLIQEDFGTTDISHTFTNQIVLTNFSVYEVVSQSTNWSAWINGVLQYSTTNNTVGFGSQFYVGSVNSGGNFGGDVAEMLIFNQGLTSAQRATIVTNYLFQKYNIPH